MSEANAYKVEFSLMVDDAFIAFEISKQIMRIVGLKFKMIFKRFST